LADVAEKELVTTVNFFIIMFPFHVVEN